MIDRLTIHNWLQTLGIIGTVAIIGVQIISDLDARKVEATLNFVVSTSNDYRDIDFKYAERVEGRLQKLSKNKVHFILCENEDADLEVRNMLAVFEWVSVGIREGGQSIPILK